MNPNSNLLVRVYREAFPDRRTVDAWVGEHKSERHPQSRLSVSHNKSTGHEKRLAVRPLLPFVLQLTNSNLDVEIPRGELPIFKRHGRLYLRDTADAERSRSQRVPSLATKLEGPWEGVLRRCARMAGTDPLLIRRTSTSLTLPPFLPVDERLLARNILVPCRLLPPPQTRLLHRCTRNATYHGRRRSKGEEGASGA